MSGWRSRRHSSSAAAGVAERRSAASASPRTPVSRRNLMTGFLQVRVTRGVGREMVRGTSPAPCLHPTASPPAPCTAAAPAAGAGSSAAPRGVHWMARSSCGSCPATTSLGVFSTSMSGSTPWFSTTHSRLTGSHMPMSGVVIRRAVHERRRVAVADQPAPGALADQRADRPLAEVVGEVVAARACELVDEHALRSVDRASPACAGPGRRGWTSSPASSARSRLMKK